MSVIYTMERHHELLRLWREQEKTGLRIVHLDFHCDMRGMFVLKWPFGSAESSAPRVGFDFDMQRKSDLDYLKEDRDPRTGERLPEIDASNMRTWSLDGPEYTLPKDREGHPDFHAGNGPSWTFEEPEIVLPDNLGQDPVFTLPDDVPAEPEDESPVSEPQPSG